MDPINNPTPTPNPVLGSNPTPNPLPNPAAPNPTANPMPGEPAAPAPMGAPMGVASAATGNPVPVNPIIEPNRVAATDPIMMPEKPAEPDPIEEELKAPMKAAAPAPGSIGSAVSGPDDGAKPAENNLPTENPFATPKDQPSNVSFTDPATESAQPAQPGAKAGKPKANKTTLIALIAVAAIIVVVLVVVLIMQITASGSTSNNNTTSNVDTNQGQNSEEETIDENLVGAVTLSCSRPMTGNELLAAGNATSGSINISAEFDDGELVSIIRNDVIDDETAVETETNTTTTETETVVVDGSETVGAEVETATTTPNIYRAKAPDLDATTALDYFIMPDDGGELDLTFYTIRDNYEDLDFTCEVL